MLWPHTHRSFRGTRHVHKSLRSINTDACTNTKRNKQLLLLHTISIFVPNATWYSCKDRKSQRCYHDHPTNILSHNLQICLTKCRIFYLKPCTVNDPPPPPPFIQRNHHKQITLSTHDRKYSGMDDSGHTNVLSIDGGKTSFYI